MGTLHEQVVVQESRRSNIGWAILVLIFAVYTVPSIVPFAPGFPRTADSETSWMLVMHAGWQSHPQFGSERIFTYGPYGFCVPPLYYPATYPILLAIRAAVAGVVLWSIWSLVPTCRRIVDSPLAVALWIFFLIGIVTSSDDVLFPLCGVLLLIIYFYVDGMKLTAKSLLLLVVLALAGLAKFTWLTINSTLVLLLTADQIFGRRRWNFWIPGLYVGFLAALWLLAGQRPASFIDYFRNSAELAAGYTQAMSSLRGEPAAIAEFGVAAALLWLLIADADWRLRGRRGMIHSLAVAIVLFATFKQSFVRHDDEAHVSVGPFMLFAMALLYAVVIWPTLLKTTHRVVWVAAVSLAMMNASAAVARQRPYGLLGQYARTIHNASQSCAGVWHLVRRDGFFRRRYESALAEVRAAEPLPPISGSTDVYPNSQAIAVAYGLDYRPRPVFQSYAAYTPKLAGANRAYLQSERAPENILFDVQTIDARLPSLDDGLSWPELLTRYNVVGLYDTTALLKRATPPRSYVLTPLKSLTARLGELISIPASPDPVWGEIDVELSPRGQLAGVLYRPPGLLIEVRMAKSNETYRLIAPIARAGFLLSPMVRTRGEFVSLASTAWQEDLKSRAVRGILISAVGFGPMANSAAYFEPEVSVKLSRIEFPHEDIASIPGWTKRLAAPESNQPAVRE